VQGKKTHRRKFDLEEIAWTVKTQGRGDRCGRVKIEGRKMSITENKGKRARFKGFEKGT